ncbi:M36 family metallopeptidase [Cystobacter fuscus]|uniref:M36 family metallopeptidase n=1 Tax=Cystobacter fuscus TaxID=43 RepID=UPI0018DF7109|nr:M36 family metallopeptidase [Cystobacter fuscus]
MPTLLWNQSWEPSAQAPATPEAIASWYLEQLAPLYHLGEATLRTASIHQVHDTGRGGILVSFRQHLEGIEVLDSELDVLLTRDLRLVAVGGNLQDVASPQPHTFRLSHGEAVAHALNELSRVAGASADLRETEPMPGGFRSFTLAPGRAFASSRMTLVLPARAKQVFYPRDGQLVPAYYVETFLGTDASNNSNAEASVISAEDGTVLRRQGLTHADSFEYRVWAETDGSRTPLDGPQADYTPHPTGTPDGNRPAFIPPRWVSMESFNGKGDVWLPSGATESRGNNVDAYADLSAPDGFTPGSDVRAATVAGSRRFDHVYDTSLGPLARAEQTQAAVTQLFYTTNWLHDDFYVSGFNEASGNAQVSNFGRGGLEGDPLLAEAQGHEGSNNAFMSVPADGQSPRMQVFIWMGPEEHFVEVSGQRYPTGLAFFGSQFFQLTKPLVLVNDGIANPSTHDGCEPMSGLGGAVVMLERGTCSMALKSRNAEQAGASGVIMINNIPGVPPPRMTNDDTSIVVKLPVLSVTYEDGARLVKLTEQQAPLPATLWRGSIDRDGSLDNTLVAHEWGHYLHLRLMVPCTTAQCLAMSEGWADFIALHMLLREGDSLEGSYALAPYASVALGSSTYFGIRRAPYSVNKGINDLSLRHISEGEPLPTHPMVTRKPGNSEIHNAGEIFASLLFEGYIALLRDTRIPTPRYDFKTIRRRMADYIVAAMKLAPANATYTEQLQALLAVAAAQDLTDHALLAEAFARRGAGPKAISPSRDSVDLTGVVEDFSVNSPGSDHPVAKAGPDQSVQGGRRVRLDASGSQAPKGGTLRFQWHQVSGSPVVLEDSGKSAATFTAPVVSKDTVLAFRVTVGLGNRATVDTVEIRVLAGDSVPVDAGTDAGTGDAGTPADDAGTDAGVEPSPVDGGTQPDAGTGDPDPGNSGCGCGAGSSAPRSTFLFTLLALLGAYQAQRRRTSRNPTRAIPTSHQEVT